MTTTPTSGAADLPEALIVAVDCWFAKSTGLGGCSNKDVRELADIFRLHTLAAGQTTAAPVQPAAQQGAAYAALPTSSHAGRVYEEGFLIGTCPLYTADKMRAFADATHALRASHGQAPATQQAREVSDAMVLAALQMQHPAAYGQYLRHPANGPKTSIRTEAEIDTARRMIAAALAAAPQPSPTAQAADSVTAPAPPPECETEAEKRAFAFGWFKALESERMKAESVQEDAARYRWLTADHHKQEDRIRVYEIATSMNVRGKGHIDAAIDAARKQGATNDR